jgi:putative PIG3 family NAD(P)H quinone oxidoreductase
MKAVWMQSPGGPEALEIREVDRPLPGNEEALVRVRASGLNRADILQRQGRYPAPAGAPENIPGIEFVGEIAGAGKGAQRWREGQRVFGICGGGAHAEFLVAHQETLASVPDGLTWSQAAAIPEAFITAHDALWGQAQLRAGEKVLIHAVGSGVGLAAVQLAKAHGASVYGSSRTRDKLERAREYGLAGGAETGGSFAELTESCKRWTDGKGFEVVLDLAGGPYVAASIDLLAVKGRLMLIGTVAGGRAELELGKVLHKRLRIMGTVLRSRPLAEKIAATQAFAQEVVPLFAGGKLHATIDSEFPMEAIQEAHRRMESNQTFGKVVITMG